ncbi:MAG: flavodoxin-dependent (E)-4-hydroxy-3-methylbut-2-enyl-diphosphate synthase [Gracilibacteraceae bacterium]|jgi:(E)-4-hydroxy-3-methylbut-2-enyl-diphosphate synthase|nr:flavodoxin-dependent (E)-4-hydroxy-3-methylbut-2-enyl-diphosphate synthase [Gracilibacteraceae bacterium]
MPRRSAKVLKIGSVPIGGDHPIVIQSMTNTDTRDCGRTLAQITALRDAGCQIVRVAVPDTAAAEALRRLSRASVLPLIADIHFDYRLALAAIAAGVQGLRLNPGNIGTRTRVREVARAARAAGVPIRIGVNAGSLERDILARHGGVTAPGLVESALAHVRLLEEENFDQIKISLKASRVPLMLAACRMLAARTDYPLHLGVTEAGTARGGVVKSAVGIGTLLAEGIGDTIRVSLTGDPVAEIAPARAILDALELRPGRVEVISCPTCARTGIDVEGLAARVEEKLTTLPALRRSLTVAVMGCAVNGPGEAREADLGVAGGTGRGVLFARGQVRARLAEDELLPALFRAIDEFVRAEAVAGPEPPP